jgi:hypothetical protein
MVHKIIGIAKPGAPAIMELAEGFQHHQEQLDELVKQLQSKRQ